MSRRPRLLAILACSMALGEIGVTGYTGATLTNLAWYPAKPGESDNPMSYSGEAVPLGTRKGQQLYVTALI